MEAWTNVRGLPQKSQLDSDTLNEPILQLKDRTEYLRRYLKHIIDEGTMSAVRYMDTALSTGHDDKPEVGDVVALDPETSKAVRALFVTDPLTGYPSSTALPFGVLVETHGDSGTVVGCGKLPVDTIHKSLESGASVQAGAYYLSHREPGKITPNSAQGSPPVCFILSTEDNGDPDSAFVYITPKDPASDHRHNGIRLPDKVAGHLQEEEDGYGDIASYHIKGFQPEVHAREDYGAHVDPGAVPEALSGASLVDPLSGFSYGNYKGLKLLNVETGEYGIITNNNLVSVVSDPGVAFDPGDRWYIEPRISLRAVGAYTGPEIRYTFKITDSTGNLVVGENAPDASNGFSDVWLKWESDHPSEPGGISRIRGYGVPIAVGNHGLSVVIDNNLEEETEPEWGIFEQAAEDISRRVWEIKAPEDFKGWNPRRVYEVLDGGTGPDIAVFGNTPQGGLRIRMAPGPRRAIAFSGNPEPGDTLRAGPHVYRFDDGTLDSEVDVENIIIHSDPKDTYTDLAIRMQQNGHVAGVNDAESTLISAVGSGSFSLSAGYTNATLDTLPGDNSLSPATVTVVNDKGKLLTDGLKWEVEGYCEPKALSNGLYVQVLRYKQDGSAASGTLSPVYSRHIADEAPGSYYVYFSDFDSGLSDMYPPTPLSAASFVVNGEERPGHALYGEEADWKAGIKGIYWYDAATPPFSTSENPRVHNTFYTVSVKSPESGAVTSLQADPDSPIEITRCGTDEPATSGDLSISARFSLSTTDNEDLGGHYVVKDVRGTSLLRGPVVSEVVPGRGISIASQVGSKPGTGRVIVSSQEGGGFEGRFSQIALQNAKQRMVGMFPYIMFPGQLDSSGAPVATPSGAPSSGIAAKIQISDQLPSESLFRMHLYMTVFGEQEIPSGSPQYARFHLRYSALHDYLPSDGYANSFLNSLIAYGSGGNEDYIVCDVKVGFDNPPSGYGVTYKAYDPFIIHNDPGTYGNEDGRAVTALGNNPLPMEGDTVGGNEPANFSDILLRPGTFVGLELKRILGQGLYNGNIGMTSVRWRLAVQ